MFPWNTSIPENRSIQELANVLDELGKVQPFQSLIYHTEAISDSFEQGDPKNTLTTIVTFINSS